MTPALLSSLQFRIAVAAPPGPFEQLSARLAADPVFVISHGAVTLAVLLLAAFGGRWLSKLAGRTPLRFERTLARSGRAARRSEDGALGQWLSRLVLVCIWFAAVVVIAINWLSDLTIAQTIHPSDVRRFVTDLAQRVVASLLVIALTLGIGSALRRSLEVTLARSRYLNPNITLLMGRGLFVAALTVGLVVVLAIWGTGVALPVTLIGALTVALSLALQDVLKNLVSGIYLLLERPFSIGDRITLTPYTGIVEDIEIRYTALRTEEGQRVIVPNSMLFSSAVVNLSAAENWRDRFTVTVPDTGRDTIERAEEHIMAALEAAPEVLKHPRPEISVTRVAGGTVALQVVYWLPNAVASNRSDVFSHVLDQVREGLDGAEVSADAAVV